MISICSPENHHRICNNQPMCGRYRLTKRKQLVEEHFDVAHEDGDWVPRYNIAPTQPVAVVRQHPKEPGRKLSMLRWGLIPSWAKDASGSARMINARSETAATLPAFRDAMKSRRCLIPADGFYEWKKNGNVRQPYCFEVNNGNLFAFAGLWDRWKNANGEWIRSCLILTTTSNAVTAPVHDRMPVILDANDYDLWLDPGMNNRAVAAELLKPFDARRMRSYPISAQINNANRDDAESARAVELRDEQARLL